MDFKKEILNGVIENVGFNNDSVFHVAYDFT